MTNPRSAVRVVGVDIARFVALAGMMATHILPPFEDGTADLTFAQSVAGGRASALFAVLAGVSLALTSGRTTPVRGRAFAAAAAGVAVRAVLIAAIGLALGEFDSGIAVILTYYGVLFLLGIPFLVLGARWLLALAALWLVVVPVLAHLVRPKLPTFFFDNPSFESLAEPGRLLGELTFTGYYPAVPWLAYLLVGMAIGRTDLTRWRAPVFLASAGGVLVAVAIVASDALLRRPGVKAELAASFGSTRVPGGGAGRRAPRHHPDRLMVVAGGPGAAHGDSVRPRADDRQRTARAGGLPGARPDAPDSHGSAVRRRRDDPDPLHRARAASGGAVGRRDHVDVRRTRDRRARRRRSLRPDAYARTTGGACRSAEQAGPAVSRRSSPCRVHGAGAEGEGLVIADHPEGQSVCSSQRGT